MSYIAKKYEKQTAVVGNGQCVTLVKAFSGAPSSSLWHEGQKLTPESVKDLATGTVIATFTSGQYPNLKHGNHAAIFVSAIPSGIIVFDQ